MGWGKACRLERFPRGTRRRVSSAARPPDDSPSTTRRRPRRLGALEPERKDLDARDLLMLGVGGVIGGGVFVLTGAAAHDHAGPAVLISYLVASATSAVTGLCYTEFACGGVPVAGSSYVYVSMCFGEVAGFLCGCNLGLELTISAAAVARGWTSYVATLFRSAAGRTTRSRGGPESSSAVTHQITPSDASSAASRLTFPRRSSSRSHVRARLRHEGRRAVQHRRHGGVLGRHRLRARRGAPWWTPPTGAPARPTASTEIPRGTSVVFFSFVGFDTVATCAEVRGSLDRTYRVGILGSLGVCAALYARDVPRVTGMTPWRDIDVEALFAVAFKTRGRAGRVGHNPRRPRLGHHHRPVIVLTRREGVHGDGEGRAPAKVVAKVHPRFGTPANAPAFTGVTTGVLASRRGHRDAGGAGEHGTLVHSSGRCARRCWCSVHGPRLLRGADEREHDGTSGWYEWGKTGRGSRRRRGKALVRAARLLPRASHRAWSHVGGPERTPASRRCARSRPRRRRPFGAEADVAFWRDETNRRRASRRVRAVRPRARGGERVRRSWCSRWGHRRG